MPREAGDRAATRAWGAGTRGSRMEGPAGGNMGLQVGMERVGRGALKGMGQGARGGVCGDIGAGVGLGGAPRGGGAPCAGDEPRGMRPLPGRPAEGTGEGSAGRPEGRPGTPLREVSVATLREVCEGRTAGTVAGGHTLRGGLLKGGSPGRLGGVPAVPGLRHVPGLPGFPALGASGCVAAAPPSPSERSAAAGPNHRSQRGEAARSRSRPHFGSPPPPGRAATLPRCRAAERCSAALGRVAAS